MNANTKMAGLLLVASLLFLGAVARAQEGNGGLFTWTDKDGVVHMTDSLDKVPNEYRSGTQRTGNGASGGKAVPEAQSPTAPATSDQGGGNDAALKAQWQSRMLDAKRRLQFAENNYQQLEKRKSELQAQWGSSGSALPPQEVLDQMKQLDADMSHAKAEIDNARDQINNIIPDEARRAGIPPGWLREVE
ncbi:MAG: DUF4124 domain-containing protein [Nitrospirae bacterium]|nr:DUF4124 domain-containing protein [Nitrospirota bacterium]NTW66776.1 DUF4124 domain-containing protein [Nitrospirota bacterium]